METLLSLLLYPGLALALALALVFGWLSEGRINFGWVRGAAWASLDGLLSLASILLAAVALALLPWPIHPAAGWPLIGDPVVLWAALEGAFLLPLLAGLLAPSQLGERAASREAQMSVAGRCVVWLALGAALWAPSTSSGQGGAGWTVSALPGRGLLALAGLLALPAAAGAGPFGAERSLNSAGAEEGLDEATAALVRFARTLRGAALLAMLIVVSLPSALIQPWIALLLCAGLFVLVALLLSRLAGWLPRLPLPAALRWCWWRALPLGVAGLVYLLVIS